MSIDFDPAIPQPVRVGTRPGVTTGRIKTSGTRTYAQVQFGTHEKQFVDITRIEPLESRRPTVTDLLIAKRFGTKGDLARILTFHKISLRLSNVFYAMQSTRTDFYAYQFKPVYKFIESANGRILIADEVGLGKTIEAGLIWQEVRARSDARTLLVVCPSMLREKWKEELRSRFEVQAQIFDGKGIRSLLTDFAKEGNSFQCAAVCSMQGLRNRSTREAFEEFANRGLHFDLVIVDEAHYMRNVRTQTHRLGQTLSTVTEHFLLLTATPLHLKREDLYRLMNVLDPNEYAEQWSFEERLEANEPIVAAQAALRRIPADLQAALKCVTKAQQSPWFASNPLLQLAATRLTAARANDRLQIVDATRILENVNLLGASVSRTRKREVQEWRVLRKAQVLPLEYAEHELNFYWGVTNAVRKQIEERGSAGFEAFVLMMPQRQMASCIPAMVRHYRGLVYSLDGETGHELGWTSPEDDDESLRSDLSPDIRELVAGWNDDWSDSKYDSLSGELRRLFRDEPATKVIIFSYFKKTLHYLAERLAADGHHSFVIHGDVPVDKRLGLLDEFRERSEVRILLSSEVGSEGLDLQYCRVLINYDLPWNPMKVEQRIGRLDRLGQRADSISIINIAARNTIEERILERLYDRIAIFERSIGDLEPILGDMMHSLEQDLLSNTLTPDQEADRIEQTRMALENKRREEVELEDQSQLFFGHSDFLLEQIRDARQSGRWITPSEVRSYVSDFFQDRYRGTQILWDRPADGLVSIDLANSAKTDLNLFARRVGEMSSILTQGGGPKYLAYTASLANEHRQREFLNHFHPMLRWISHSYAAQGQPDPFFPSVAIRLRTSTVPAGRYLFLIEQWRFSAILAEPQIAYVMVNLDDGSRIDPIVTEQLIQELLSTGQNWTHADKALDVEVVRSAIQDSESLLEHNRESAFTTFKCKMQGIYERKRAHRENYLSHRTEVIHRTIQNLLIQHKEDEVSRKRSQAQIRGQETLLSNLQAKIQQELDAQEKASEASLEFDEVAGGVCQITN